MFNGKKIKKLEEEVKVLKREISSINKTIKDICKHDDGFEHTKYVDYCYGSFYEKTCKICGKKIYLTTKEFLNEMNELKIKTAKELLAKNGYEIKD